MTEDDTGLYYMRARYYSPVLRRFVNADRVHGDITNALTLNRYAFVNGNLAAFVDPEGLKGVDGRGAANSYTTSYLEVPHYYSSGLYDEEEDSVNLAMAPDGWYNSADEAAYAFGVDYNKISVKKEVEYAATIYSKVAYEYNGAKYTLPSILDLYKNGKIKSMSEFYKTTSKSRIYTYGSVVAEIKDSVDANYETGFGKISAVVHTHSKSDGNRGNNYFSEKIDENGNKYGDINYADAVYKYGIKDAIPAMYNIVSLETLSASKGIKDFAIYLITADGEIKKYVPSVHKYQSDYDKDISELIPHDVDIYSQFAK